MAKFSNDGDSKEKILKWIDVGVIYPISDNKWKSPIHVVLKKSRITVVKNSENHLVSLKIQIG